MSKYRQLLVLRFALAAIFLIALIVSSSYLLSPTIHTRINILLTHPQELINKLPFIGGLIVFVTVLAQYLPKFLQSIQTIRRALLQFRIQTPEDQKRLSKCQEAFKVQEKYIERPPLEEVTRFNLLSRRSPQFLEIVGDEGMGKDLLLRTLIVQDFAEEYLGRVVLYRYIIDDKSVFKDEEEHMNTIMREIELRVWFAKRAEWNLPASQSDLLPIGFDIQREFAQNPWLIIVEVETNATVELNAELLGKLRGKRNVMVLVHRSHLTTSQKDTIKQIYNYRRLNKSPISVDPLHTSQAYRLFQVYCSKTEIRTSDKGIIKAHLDHVSPKFVMGFSRKYEEENSIIGSNFSHSRLLSLQDGNVGTLGDFFRVSLLSPEQKLLITLAIISDVTLIDRGLLRKSAFSIKNWSINTVFSDPSECISAYNVCKYKGYIKTRWMSKRFWLTPFGARIANEVLVYSDSSVIAEVKSSLMEFYYN